MLCFILMLLRAYSHIDLDLAFAILIKLGNHNFSCFLHIQGLIIAMETFIDKCEQALKN